MIKNIKELLLVILIIVMAAASLSLFGLKNIAQSDRIMAEDQLYKEKIHKTKADEVLSREEKDRDSIKKVLAKIKQEMTFLQSELARRKSKVGSMRHRMVEIDAGSDSTGIEYEQAILNVTELKGRIANVVKDTLQLREELALLKKTTDALKGRFKDYIGKKSPKSNISVRDRHLSEPEERGLTQAAEAVSEPAFVGEVLTVNREFDFIIVNLGKNDGIKEGMIFNVSRDDRVLGRAEVETVRGNISAASLIDKEAISWMRAGDRVYSVLSM